MFELIMKSMNLSLSTNLDNYIYDDDNLIIAAQPQIFNLINFNDYADFFSKFSQVDLISKTIHSLFRSNNNGVSKDILANEKYFPLFLDRDGGIFIIPPDSSRHDCSNRPHVLTRFLKQRNLFGRRIGVYGNKTIDRVTDNESIGTDFQNGDQKFFTHERPAPNLDTNMSPQDPRYYPVVAKLDIMEFKKLRIVVFCEYQHIISFAIAIARAFPAFHAKSSKKNSSYYNNGERFTINNVIPKLSHVNPAEKEGGKDNDFQKKDVVVTFLVVNPKFELCNLNSHGTIPDQKDRNLLHDERQFRYISQQDANMLYHLVYGVRLTSLLVDMPCNLFSTNEFIEMIQRIGTELGIVPKIIRGKDLELKGFGGLYGVGKASENPPALVVLSHEPANSQFNTAWVGKGIVYDTGGLSLKSKLAMVGMKRDCGGAAAILGAFYACVKLGFSHRLHAVFCLAENSIGPNATRPDDIHTLYSGKTVEINNTDAEGRLVLGDGVAFASNDLKCDIILDMATLTGAQGIATGKYHGALITNDESWEKYCFEAGKLSGDLVFPLPYCPELHFSEFKSALADMKNSVADRNNAQSSCAGLFIASHLKKGFEFPGVWMHVDMAAPADIGERATGYGVGLLLALFGFGSQDNYLKSHCPISGETILKQYSYLKSLHSEQDRDSVNLHKENHHLTNLDNNSSNIGQDDPFGIIGAKSMKEYGDFKRNLSPDIDDNLNTDTGKRDLNNQAHRNVQKNFRNFDNDAANSSNNGLTSNNNNGDNYLSQEDRKVTSHINIKKSILPPNARLSAKRNVAAHRASEPILEGGY